MTLPETTVAAINVALEVLDSDGALSIISYVGHEGRISTVEFRLGTDTSLYMDNRVWCKLQC